jgi:hypothetical protein
MPGTFYRGGLDGAGIPSASTLEEPMVTGMPHYISLGWIDRDRDAQCFNTVGHNGCGDAELLQPWRNWWVKGWQTTSALERIGWATGSALKASGCESGSRRLVGSCAQESFARFDVVLIIEYTQVPKVRRTFEIFKVVEFQIPVFGEDCTSYKGCSYEHTYHRFEPPTNVVIVLKISDII